MEAAAAETLNDVEVALVSATELAIIVYPLPAWVIVRSLKVATPATAFTVVVPLIVACDDTVMLAVLSVTMFPSLSSTATLTEGDMVFPATVLDGC